MSDDMRCGIATKGSDGSASSLSGLLCVKPSVKINEEGHVVIEHHNYDESGWRILCIENHSGGPLFETFEIPQFGGPCCFDNGFKSLAEALARVNSYT